MRLFQRPYYSGMHRRSTTVANLAVPRLSAMFQPRPALALAPAPACLLGRDITTTVPRDVLVRTYTDAMCVGSMQSGRPGYFLGTIMFFSVRSS